MIKSVLAGVGFTAWLFWLFVVAGLVFVLVPSPLRGEMGIFIGFIVALKIECNRLNIRIDSLEEQLKQAK